MPALLGLYLLALALASIGHRKGPAPRRPPRRRIVVLVPAHNEQALVARCVRSLTLQSYPRRLLRILVVADNCTDATAAVAAAAGAEVLVRTDELARGKGHALRWAMDRVLAEPDPPDALAVVDADSVAEPHTLVELEAHLDGGPAVQGEYLVLTDGSTRTQLMAAAFLLFHRVRLGGRARLGLPAALVGNGMLFSRPLLEAHPWDAFTGVEDLECTIRLRLAGIRPVYAPLAVVRGPMAGGYREAAGQRARWEGGRLHAMRTWLPTLLRRGLREPELLDACLDLAVPPLGLLVFVVAAGAAVAGAAVLLAGVPAWSMAGWAVAGASIALFVGVGLPAAHAPLASYLALLETPRFLLWKLLAYGRLARGFDPGRWDRTQRGAEAPPT
ncbi:MAG: glycosyltransferase [Actinobacteria bacterium]|nr:glycosyltransferase [Actinomycetota bacterium]